MAIPVRANARTGWRHGDGTDQSFTDAASLDVHWHHKEDLLMPLPGFVWV